VCAAAQGLQGSKGKATKAIRVAEKARSKKFSTRKKSFYNSASAEGSIAF
jgi:hypothetical protein